MASLAKILSIGLQNVITYNGALLEFPIFIIFTISRGVKFLILNVSAQLHLSSRLFLVRENCTSSTNSLAGKGLATCHEGFSTCDDKSRDMLLVQFNVGFTRKWYRQ